jgi:hypothetical protein
MYGITVICIRLIKIFPMISIQPTRSPKNNPVQIPSAKQMSNRLDKLRRENIVSILNNDQFFMRRYKCLAVD